jgi:hypothetical protein
MRLEGHGLTFEPAATASGRRQLSNPHFGFLVVAFAEVVIAHLPGRIDKVERWPVELSQAVARPSEAKSLAPDVR